jgi:methylglyoxal synthase
MKKCIVLIAHDAKKEELAEWVKSNMEPLEGFEIFATRATGIFLEQRLGLKVNLLKSGPLGGDAQVGSMIVEEKADIVVFFWDPLTPQPHDVDVKALLRLAVLYNIPIACNRSTADYLISSPLFRMG